MLERGNRERRAANAKVRKPRNPWTAVEIDNLAALLIRFKYKWTRIANMPQMHNHAGGMEIRDKCVQLRNHACRAGFDLAQYLDGALFEEISGKPSK